MCRSDHRIFDCYVLCALVASSYVWGAPAAVSKDDSHQKQIDLLMPNIQPTVMDSYLCYPLKVDSKYYITGFLPKAQMETAHHVLLYGCLEPGHRDNVWDCGEMHSSMQEFQQGSVCKEGSSIIYAWAMDAPELHLPEGVGFKVGDDTAIKWIVLQVHYKDVTAFIPPRNGVDHSGVTLLTTDIVQPKRAGVYLMGTFGSIPPHSVTYMETACSFNEPTVLHPFAFRTHAHTHGKVISGYRVRDGEWTEIGRKSPQLPQMFYNVTTPGLTIVPGDILAARCTMANDDNKTVAIGSTSKDEMCNFYMIYYVDGDRIAEENYCFSSGPPDWNWYNMDGIYADKAPLNASIIPGTTEIIKSTEKFLKQMEQSADRAQQRLEDNVNDIIEALKGYNREIDVEALTEPRLISDDLNPDESKRVEDFYRNYGDDVY